MEVHGGCTLVYVLEEQLLGVVHGLQAHTVQLRHSIRIQDINEQFSTKRPIDPCANRYKRLTDYQLGAPNVKSLTVMLKIEIVEKIKPNVDYGKLIDDLQTLSTNESLSDVTLLVGDRKFKAHKVILMARNAVFASMFTCDMLEKATNEVMIEDIEPDIFKELLGFVYCGRIGSGELGFEEMVALLKAADKYSMDDLKLVCATNICKYLDVNKAADILILADQYRLDDLKKRSMKFIVANIKQVILTDSYKQLVQLHVPLIVEMFGNIGTE